MDSIKYIEENGKLYKQIGFFKILVDKRDQSPFLDTEIGDVYFIKIGDVVKIGVTKDIKSRLQVMQSHNSEKVELLVTIPGGKKLEKILHEGFKMSHKNGEFYYFSKEIKEYISLIKEIYR